MFVPIAPSRMTTRSLSRDRKSAGMQARAPARRGTTIQMSITEGRFAFQLSRGEVQAKTARPAGVPDGGPKASLSLEAPKVGPAGSQGAAQPPPTLALHGDCLGHPCPG